MLQRIKTVLLKNKKTSETFTLWDLRYNLNVSSFGNGLYAILLVIFIGVMTSFLILTVGESHNATHTDLQIILEKLELQQQMLNALQEWQNSQ